MAGEPVIREKQRGSAIQLGSRGGFSIREIELPLVHLPGELDGLRIVHLTDAHFGRRWHAAYDRLLAAVESENADLICFTGDWVDDKYDFRIGLDVAQRFARGLKSKFGTFSCLGNHDGDLIAPYLLDAGVKLMVGESRRILGGESAIELVGLPGVARKDLSPILVDSFGEPAESTLRIVLMHFPDQIQAVAPMRPDLVLAGHTHGGQICLPGGRPIITHDSLPREYASGLHRLHDTWLHVSRGLGWTGLPVRAFCSREVTTITLRRSLRP